MAYVSQAQARLLDSLRGNLAQVEVNRDKVENAKDELDEIAQEQRDQKAMLEKEKARRAALLGTLSSKLAAQRKEADTPGARRAAHDRPGRQAGAPDPRTGRSRAASARQPRLRPPRRPKPRPRPRKSPRAGAGACQGSGRTARRARAGTRTHRAPERQRQTGRQARAAAGAAPEPVKEAPVVAEQPRPAPTRPEPAPDVALAPAAPSGSFAGLKGRMRTPGQWQRRGPFRRPAAATARAGKACSSRRPKAPRCAPWPPGRVVFADWMRGFGNLIIVDHGGQYLSIYGNNQALLKRPGDSRARRRRDRQRRQHRRQRRIGAIL